MVDADSEHSRGVRGQGAFRRRFRLKSPPDLCDPFILHWYGIPDQIPTNESHTQAQTIEEPNNRTIHCDGSIEAWCG
jgi:hypothetical protein